MKIDRVCRRFCCMVFILGSFPLFAVAQENTAKLYVARKSFIGTPVRPEISVNGISVGKLSNKKYIECTVPAGNISVSLFYSPSGQSEQVNFRVESGKKYYVKATLTGTSPGSTTLSVNMSRMSVPDGEQMIKKLKQELVADLSDYGDSETSVSSDMYAQTQPAVQQPTPMAGQQKKESEETFRSDVDVNIPETKEQNKNTFVLIIANEDYAFVDNVEYALNDGRAFREYCVKTLGVPERQVWLYENASLGIISSGVNKMLQAMNIFSGARAVIYYCGHGIPDEKTGDAYIVPVDGRGTDVSSCYSLNKLYKTIASAKTSTVTYFMDACFTGANRDGSMLVAARGVAREAKKEEIEGNTIVFSAASGDETAMPFKDKRHGLFTYFLLKKLQETSGNVTYGELAEYINTNVKSEAFLTNEKPQNPVIATSKDFATSWKSVKMK